ncbi:MAG: hypothetical protein HPY78_03460 [Brevinematales bacterium]|nr:hypothetical protein [Brevinematales bacterium]
MESEFIRICLECGLTWDQIFELTWRLGGGAVYVPSLVTIKKDIAILREYERECEVAGHYYALRCLLNKGLSRKRLYRILSRRYEYKKAGLL